MRRGLVESGLGGIERGVQAASRIVGTRNGCVFASPRASSPFALDVAVSSRASARMAQQTVRLGGRACQDEREREIRRGTLGRTGRWGAEMDQPTRRIARPVPTRESSVQLLVVARRGVKQTACVSWVRGSWSPAGLDLRLNSDRVARLRGLGSALHSRADCGRGTASAQLLEFKVADDRARRTADVIAVQPCFDGSLRRDGYVPNGIPQEKLARQGIADRVCRNEHF